MGETATTGVRVGRGDGACPRIAARNYLVNVNTVVQRPHSLEVVLHPVFELAGHLVQRQEVLEVPPLALVQRPPGVHSLDDGRHVTEHHSVHERYNSITWLVISRSVQLKSGRLMRNKSS